MTNGEMIQKVFNCKVCEPLPEDDMIHVIFSDKSNSAIGFDWSWWNMEYKEPTTKNNLGVDREDAVERLNALKQFIGYDKDSEIVKATQKSLDMAIRALEHPERNVVAIVPCGDTISRQAVLDLMMQKWGENFSGDSAMQESIDAIRVLPSVTPQEPKTGHWILDETDNSITCDKCACLIWANDISNGEACYCPNCGAKMVVPQESEDEK